MQKDEIIKKIYDRFIDDPAGFAVAFTNIFQEKDGTPQTLYPLQIEFLNNKKKPGESIVAVVKCRQSGFSTSIKAKALHHAYFGLVPNILIASASERQAQKIMTELKEHFESMPEFLKPNFSRANATELHLESGSKLISLPANPQTVRGFSGLVFWDECSMFSRKDSEKFFSAIYPSVSKGYQLILVSTPDGKDNKFYDLCNPKLDENGEEKKGIKAGKIIKVMWNKVPHIKKFIEEEEIEDYSDKTFLQEYCCEFLEDAEDSLFNLELIDGKFIDKELTLYSLKEIEMPEDDNKPGWISSEYVRKDIKERYDKIFIGYDPSISSAKDSDGSAIIAVGIKGEIWEIIFIRKLPKGMTQKDQCNYVSRLALCLQADKIGFDSTGGMGLTFEERLKDTPIKNKLVSVNFGGNFKQQEYSELKHRIEANKIKCPEHAEMRKQILNLGYNGSTGQIKAMGSWRTNKDDIPSALLCALACRNKKSKAAFTIL